MLEVAVTEDPIETEETSVVNETHTDETTLPDHSSITGIFKCMTFYRKTWK